METNQFNIQNPTDSHTQQKVNTVWGRYVSETVFQVSRK